MYCLQKLKPSIFGYAQKLINNGNSTKVASSSRLLLVAYHVKLFKMASKKIKLELTEAQFLALFSLAEEMAITVGMVNEELANSVNKRVNLINKAFKQNGINYEITR